jgi:hypothetical protein
LKIFEPLSQCHQEDSEFLFFYVISAKLRFPWESIFGELKCPHDSWFGFGQLFNLDYILNPCFGFLEGDIPVSVVVEGFPVLRPQFDLGRVSFA